MPVSTKGPGLGALGRFLPGLSISFRHGWARFVLRSLRGGAEAGIRPQALDSNGPRRNWLRLALCWQPRKPGSACRRTGARALAGPQYLAVRPGDGLHPGPSQSEPRHSSTEHGVPSRYNSEGVLPLQTPSRTLPQFVRASRRFRPSRPLRLDSLSPWPMKRRRSATLSS